jgi:undecaprenyl diphosphate synthase
MDKNQTTANRLGHIAFIMDGNGRWAQKRGMPREYGHREGALVFKRISEYCGDIGIKTVTVYALSTENLANRPKGEIAAIMSLLREYIFEALATMAAKDARIVFLGDISVFDPDTVRKMEQCERESAGNHRLLNIAVNYGGRAEIVRACNRLIAQGKTNVTESDIERNLYTSHCAPPDLIVRTGAEKRLSNFLMWQSAYSELYFSDVLWPDFTEADVDAAVAEFYSRKRRFGGI